jgi:hypothetical protein
MGKLANHLEGPSIYSNISGIVFAVSVTVLVPNFTLPERHFDRWPGHKAQFLRLFWLRVVVKLASEEVPAHTRSIRYVSLGVCSGSITICFNHSSVCFSYRLTKARFIAAFQADCSLAIDRRGKK